MPSQHGRWMWFVRQYAWVVAAVTCALAAAPLLVAPVTPTYQAEALVVAQQLGVHPRVLPQLAASIFDSGTVASRVAADPAVEVDARELVPERLSVVAGEDTVALIVQARDPDPVTAARLADLAAAAYVDQLNRSGAGVGTFSAQAPAVVPTQPLATLSAPARVGIGAVAGLLLGIGLVALLATIRRPVLTARDVEEVAGVPLLGVVGLPRGPRGYTGPRGVRGIATVTRWLATVPSGRLIFISPLALSETRKRVFVAVAVALQKVKPVRVEAAPDVADAVQRQWLAGQTAVGEGAGGGELVLVDGGSPLDALEPAPGHLTVVAVAPEGVSRRRLRALTADYAEGGGLAGVILVAGSGRPGPVPQAQEVGAAAPARDVRPAGDIWQPERA